MGPLVLATTLLLAAPPAADGVRLTLSGPAVPHAEVVYEVLAERGTVTVGVARRFAADFGQSTEVALLPRPELDALMARLAGMGVFALTDADDPAARVRLRLEARRGDATVAVTVADPDRAADERAQAALTAVRAVVRANTPPSTFSDPMLLPTEAGRLRIRSRPPARVGLDGVRLEARTPINSLRVPVGAHTLELETDTGVVRRYDVKVEAGKTTSVDVDLR
ncbi:MAG: PEGA domain-containing protein [Myxococcales bacterium]|nr:PEGA domain-containing protein [Myxococcales bacterium]